MIHDYKITFIIIQNHTEYPCSSIVQACNAKQARKVFDEMYWKSCLRNQMRIPHPFYIKIRRIEEDHNAAEEETKGTFSSDI